MLQQLLDWQAEGALDFAAGPLSRTGALVPGYKWANTIAGGGPAVVELPPAKEALRTNFFEGFASCGWPRSAVVQFLFPTRESNLAGMLSQATRTAHKPQIDALTWLQNQHHRSRPKLGQGHFRGLVVADGRFQSFFK